ncbi:hypothetical protein AQ436_01925 [Arthrobacter sp. EpRS66]|nr:hypothetical protein AQ436_01925 [Arthrobacter sp. EpRS66]
MTNARALVFQGSFGDPTLPKANLFYTSPLQYAVYDWAADGLPLGPIANWQSLNGGASFNADPAGVPTVIDSGGSRAVSFDGVNDRMRIQYSRTTPHTIAAVFRLVNPEPGAAILYGYLNASPGSIMRSTVGDTLAANNGSTWITPSPDIPSDTSWHVALLSLDGANTVLRIDGKEATGNFAAGNRDGLTLGFKSGGNFRAAIEYKRVVQFSGPAVASTRSAIVNSLAARYGIAQ